MPETQELLLDNGWQCSDCLHMCQGTDPNGPELCGCTDCPGCDCAALIDDEEGEL